jgi:sugar/nucleoside kinase (ribokinase family)
MKNFGGKGSNQAAMIAKLCSKPCLNFISCLGNDEGSTNLFFLKNFFRRKKHERKL